MKRKLVNIQSKITETIEFPFSKTPKPGEVQKITQDLFWIRMPLPFALDHINLWLIRDGDGWTAVDSGIKNSETKKCWDKILNESLEGSLLKKIVVTHFHPDHVGNAAWLASKFHLNIHMTQSEFLVTHACYHGFAGQNSESTIKLFAAHGLNLKNVDNDSPVPNAYRFRVEEPPSSYIRIADQEKLLIGDNEWQIIVGYGHAPEHASLYCEALGLLIAGDMLLPKITTNISVEPNNPDGNPLKSFLESIKKFHDIPHNVLILPSHGLPFKGGKTRAIMLDEHHSDRFSDIIAACIKPQTAYQLLPVLFKRSLDSHQIFFAMGEAIAHLNYLWQNKQLRRIVSSENIISFETIT